VLVFTAGVSGDKVLHQSLSALNVNCRPEDPSDRMRRQNPGWRGASKVKAESWTMPREGLHGSNFTGKLESP
jgi:hypothetical protein